MLNCIILQGRLKDAPTLRHTYSNTAVASAVLAVQRSRKNQDGEYPVDWIDVVFWGKTAEHAAKWFGKGDMALVRGRLESRDWEDKQGNRRRSWEVQAESIDFCGKKQDKAQPDVQPEDDDFTELDEGDADDVPF